MNAHIHHLDGYTDTNGKLLLDLCEQCSLEIAQGLSVMGRSRGKLETSNRTLIIVSG